MGSKHRLLPWLESVLGQLNFETALDGFSGSGCVSYLLKVMGKDVHSNDFLAFATDFARATVENSTETLSAEDVERLLEPAPSRERFIEQEFDGIFFSHDDRVFLDQVWANASGLSKGQLAIAMSALYRSCIKKQPRGVFTVGGGRYDDGRRDLRLTLQDHFLESVDIFNGLVFDSGCHHVATTSDIFALAIHETPDLVYLDPPYVPRADDNCYVKRYHFLEGLATYWRGAEFHPTSKVKKLRKRYTPFSYRRTAESAFEQLFETFRDSTIVLSYSSSGYPDLPRLVELLRRQKSEVEVFSEEHRYHFGTHSRVSDARKLVTEYLIVGQ
jgi:adenine-specific DNA-methyltransferase